MGEVDKSKTKKDIEVIVVLGQVIIVLHQGSGVNWVHCLVQISMSAPIEVVKDLSAPVIAYLSPHSSRAADLLFLSVRGRGLVFFGRLSSVYPLHLDLKKTSCEYL